MKTFKLRIISLSVLCMLFCNSIMAQYHDAAIFDLKGPVKSCTINPNHYIKNTYTFSREGKLTSHNSNSNFNIQRDNEGYIVKAKKGVCDYTYKYNSRRQLIEKTTYSNGKFHDNILYQDYNSNGFYETEQLNGETCEYSDYVSDSHGNWIERIELIDGLTFTEIRTITYWDNSNTTSTPDTNNAGSAKIKGTRVIYLEYGSELAFQMNVTVDNAMNKNIMFVTYYYDENKKPLKDYNNKFHSADGNVSSSETDKSNYKSCHWECINTRIPISELHLSNGWHTIYIKPCIYNNDDKKWILSSEPMRQVRLYINGNNATSFEAIGGEATPGYFD